MAVFQTLQSQLRRACNLAVLNCIRSLVTIVCTTRLLRLSPKKNMGRKTNHPGGPQGHNKHIPDARLVQGDHISQQPFLGVLFQKSCSLQYIASAKLRRSQRKVDTKVSMPWTDTPTTITVQYLLSFIILNSIGSSRSFESQWAQFPELLWSVMASFSHVLLAFEISSHTHMVAIVSDIILLTHHPGLAACLKRRTPNSVNPTQPNSKWQGPVFGRQKPATPGPTEFQQSLLL